MGHSQKVMEDRIYCGEEILCLAVTLLNYLKPVSGHPKYNYEFLLKPGEEERAAGFISSLCDRLCRIYIEALSDYRKYFLTEEDWNCFLAEKTLIESVQIYFELRRRSLQPPLLVDEQGIYSTDIGNFLKKPIRKTVLTQPFEKWLMAASAIASAKSN